MEMKSRRSREEWLEQALEVLAREGQAKIRIEKLSQDLGVTKGSFYWHFTDRKDFLRKLVEYWAETFTQAVIDEIVPLENGPEKRLLALMEFLYKGSHARYDIAVRAWAVQEPEVADVVRRVDQMRMTFVGSLFEEMGFKGLELEMRARTFVCFHSLEDGLFLEQSKKERKQLIKLRHQFFTQT